MMTQVYVGDKPLAVALETINDQVQEQGSSALQFRKDLEELMQRLDESSREQREVLGRISADIGLDETRPLVSSAGDTDRAAPGTLHGAVCALLARSEELEATVSSLRSALETGLSSLRADARHRTLHAAGKATVQRLEKDHAARLLGEYFYVWSHAAQAALKVRRNARLLRQCECFVSLPALRLYFVRWLQHCVAGKRQALDQMRRRSVMQNDRVALLHARVTSTACHQAFSHWMRVCQARQARRARAAQMAGESATMILFRYYYRWMWVQRQSHKLAVLHRLADTCCAQRDADTLRALMSRWVAYIVGRRRMRRLERLAQDCHHRRCVFLARRYYYTLRYYTLERQRVRERTALEWRLQRLESQSVGLQRQLADQSEQVAESHLLMTRLLTSLSEVRGSTLVDKFYDPSPQKHSKISSTPRESVAESHALRSAATAVMAESQPSRRWRAAEDAPDGFYDSTTPPKLPSAMAMPTTGELPPRPALGHTKPHYADPSPAVRAMTRDVLSYQKQREEQRGQVGGAAAIDLLNHPVPHYPPPNSHYPDAVLPHGTVVPPPSVQRSAHKSH